MMNRVVVAMLSAGVIALGSFPGLAADERTESNAPLQISAALPGSPLLLGAGLDRAVHEAVRQNPNISLVAAETDGGAIKFYSAGNLRTGVNVPPEKALFEIGSITKVFTALLLAQAVVEHRVNPDDPISRFLPHSLKLAPGTAAITLRQLATHTSGLPRIPDHKPADKLNPYADIGVKDLYRCLENYKEISPSQKPSYSNLGVGLLGHVLTLVYGKPYPQLLAEKITGPLGLGDTVIDPSAEQKTRLARPRDGGQPVKSWEFDALMGCGAIRSTASDLIRFAQGLMAEDSPMRAAWELVRQPQFNDSDSDQIGLVIVISHVRGETVYSHNGGTGVYRSRLEFSPRTGHILVILANNTEVNPESMADALYHTGLTQKTPEQKARLSRPEVPLALEKLQEYTGTYGSPKSQSGKGHFTVVTDDTGQLRWRITGHSFRPVYYEGNDRFFSRWANVEVQFHRDADGKISSMTLREDGEETTMPRSETPPSVVRFLKPSVLEGYVGNYQFGTNRQFEITLKSDQLYAKITGQSPWPVFAEGPADHFVYDVVDASLSFQRDADGTIKGLVLHQDGENRPLAIRIK